MTARGEEPTSMTDDTDKTPTTAEEIRAKYVNTIALTLAQADACRCEPSMFTHAAGLIADALAEAGLLPIGAGYRWVYEPDGTPLGYRERQLLTDWREAPALCPGCGVTERQCGRWRDASARCCTDCRHPLRAPE